MDMFRDSTASIHFSPVWVEAPVCAPLINNSECKIVRTSTRGEVGSVAVVVVVRAHFLHQFVISAVERNEDADNFERFGAEPGDVALGLLLVAGLGWVEVAKCVLGALLHLLILNAAVEGL